MRLALCLSGEMRNCPECLNSLSQCIARPFLDAGWETDLFIWTRKDDWWKAAGDLRFRTLHVERNVKQDESKIISPVNPKSRGSYPSETDRRGFFYQSYLHYYRSLRGVWRLCKDAENQDGKSYDLVARVRPDVSYKRPLLLAELDFSKINLPDNDWWPYTYPAGTPEGEGYPNGRRIDALSDKFAIGPSLLMDVYFNRIHYLEEFCQRYELMAEALMMYQLERAAVPYRRIEGWHVLRSEKMYEYSWRPDREGK